MTTQSHQIQSVNSGMVSENMARLKGLIKWNDSIRTRQTAGIQRTVALRIAAIVQSITNSPISHNQSDVASQALMSEESANDEPKAIESQSTFLTAASTEGLDNAGNADESNNPQLGVFPTQPSMIALSDPHLAAHNSNQVQSDQFQHQTYSPVQEKS